MNQAVMETDQQIILDALRIVLARAGFDLDRIIMAISVTGVN
jgi:hypothetical protein